MAEDKMSKRAKKKAEKAEKERQKKGGIEGLDYEGESSTGSKILTFFVKNDERIFSSL